MNDIHLPPSNQPANLQGGGEPPAPRRNAMHGDACVLCPASQQGIPDCNQFRRVAAREQSLQEQQRLVLPAAVVPSEVDDHWMRKRGTQNRGAHAQASPGFGHERCVSFSPASSRPSLRYLT